MKYTTTTLALIMLVPSVAFGVEFKTLVNFPGVGDPLNSFDSFIDGLYVLSISIAALLAVIKIVVAGVKYMMTDIVTSKGEAKKDITGAIIGLIVILSAVLILTVINPNLTKFNLSGIPEIPLKGGSGGGGGNGGSSNTLSYTQNPGDMVIPVPPSNVPGFRKESCEQINPDKCNFSSQVDCYEGEYYDDKGGVCVIRKDNLVSEGSTFSCTFVGQNNTGQDIYDCSQAIAKCDNARTGLVAVNNSLFTDTISETTEVIECEWP